MQTWTIWIRKYNEALHRMFQHPLLTLQDNTDFGNIMPVYPQQQSLGGYTELYESWHRQRGHKRHLYILNYLAPVLRKRRMVELLRWNYTRYHRPKSWTWRVLSWFPYTYSHLIIFLWGRISIKQFTLYDDLHYAVPIFLSTKLPNEWKLPRDKMCACGRNAVEY